MDRRLFLTSSIAGILFAPYLTCGKIFIDNLVTGSGVAIWFTGVLQSSNNITGVYTTISGAKNPYITSVSGSNRFFRSH